MDFFNIDSRLAQRISDNPEFVRIRWWVLRFLTGGLNGFMVGGASPPYGVIHGIVDDRAESPAFFTT